MPVIVETIKEGDNVTFSKSGQTVSCHYVLTLENGKKIDSSRDRGKPFVFKIGKGEVVKGWDEGIVKMSVGQRAKLTISPDLGYGDNGTETIPGQATLVLDLELLGICVSHSQKGNSQVEIHEVFDGPSMKNVQRIAHTPKWAKPEVEKIPPEVLEPENENAKSVPRSADIEELMKTKPKGISEKDFLEFMSLVDEIVSSDSEEDDYDDENEDEDVTQEVEENLNEEEQANALLAAEPEVSAEAIQEKGDANKKKGHVHFSERLCEFRGPPAEPETGVDENAKAGAPILPSTAAGDSSKQAKPILRNKNEISPINEPWMSKIRKNEEPVKRELISQNLFSDVVVERNVDSLTNAISDGCADNSKGRPSQRTMSKFKKLQLAKKKK